MHACMHACMCVFIILYNRHSLGAPSSLPQVTSAPQRCGKNIGNPKMPTRLCWEATRWIACFFARSSRVSWFFNINLAEGNVYWKLRYDLFLLGSLPFVYLNHFGILQTILFLSTFNCRFLFAQPMVFKGKYQVYRLDDNDRTSNPMPANWPKSFPKVPVVKHVLNSRTSILGMPMRDWFPGMDKDLHVKTSEVWGWKRKHLFLFSFCAWIILNLYMYNLVQLKKRSIFKESTQHVSILVSVPRHVLQHIVGTTQDQYHIGNFLKSFKTLLKALQHRPNGEGVGTLLMGVCRCVFGATGWSFGDD